MIRSHAEKIPHMEVIEIDTGNFPAFHKASAKVDLRGA